MKSKLFSSAVAATILAAARGAQLVKGSFDRIVNQPVPAPPVPTRFKLPECDSDQLPRKGARALLMRQRREFATKLRGCGLNRAQRRRLARDIVFKTA